MFLAFQKNAPGYQFVDQIAWVESLKISYHVGVDGINVGLILMGPLSLCRRLRLLGNSRPPKGVLHLIARHDGGILGAFASLDLFLLFLPRTRLVLPLS